MAGDADRRPDPEELLRRVEAEERRLRRGRLKIFLGYASRVGKSLRMFDEGRRRRERGEDVVAAALQPVLPPDLLPILQTIEMVPPARTLDIAAILKRRPEICIIDPLAFENPPASRHAQRWEDIDELLEHGIGVLTAINVQHIEGTGLPAPRQPSVPLAFLREADEIEVVDAPLEALLDRGDDTAPDARRLAELRERALLVAADVIERELREYLDARGVPSGWGAQERILVCLTPRSNAAPMLESGQRNARRFHGVLLAVYVEQGNLGAEDRNRIASHLALARRLGAEVHCLKGGDFVAAILRFAREQRVTQIFIGHSFTSRTSRFSRSAVEKLIDAAVEYDVRLFPHTGAR